MDGSTHPSPVVSATAAASAAVRRLTQVVGPLVIVQGEGCCDGGAPMVMAADELPLTDEDVCIGEVQGAPFYVDGRQLPGWVHGDVQLAVADGPGEDLSLRPRPGSHFVCRWGHGPGGGDARQRRGDGASRR